MLLYDARSRVVRDSPRMIELAAAASYFCLDTCLRTERLSSRLKSRTHRKVRRPEDLKPETVEGCLNFWHEKRHENNVTFGEMENNRES